MNELSKPEKLEPSFIKTKTRPSMPVQLMKIICTDVAFGGGFFHCAVHSYITLAFYFTIVLRGATHSWIKS